MFFPSETVMYLTPYHVIKSNWISVKLNKFQLYQLKGYIEVSFQEKENQFDEINITCFL